MRVRILVDDGDTVAGDEQILALGRHPNVEVRVFNPFDYRGHNAFLRHLDFVFHKGRLDYRMHNKLMVVDNAVALVGGRNVGNQYFQVDPRSQFADDDVFAAGEIAPQLSKTFDEYWNSVLAVPATALPLPKSRPTDRDSGLRGSGIDYSARIASGQPYLPLVSDDAALTWSHAEVVCDSPDKKDVVQQEEDADASWRGKSPGHRRRARGTLDGDARTSFPRKASSHCSKSSGRRTPVCASSAIRSNPLRSFGAIGLFESFASAARGRRRALRGAGAPCSARAAADRRALYRATATMACTPSSTLSIGAASISGR